MTVQGVGVRRYPLWSVPATGLWMVLIGAGGSTIWIDGADVTVMVLWGALALVLYVLILVVVREVAARRGGRATGLPARRYARITLSLQRGRPPRGPQELAVAGRLHQQVVATRDTNANQRWVRWTPLLWLALALMYAFGGEWGLVTLYAANAVGTWYAQSPQFKNYERRWLDWLEREARLPGRTPCAPKAGHHPPP